MNMKEFLENIESQQKRVQMMQEEYRRIRHSLAISGINYESTGAVAASRKTDAMAEMIAEMVDFENEIKQEECRLSAMKLKAISAISKLSNDRERDVLYRWYLLYERELEIRASGYSRTSMYRYLSAGLNHLEILVQNGTNWDGELLDILEKV